MAIPLNPAAWLQPQRIQNLAQARMWVERFARPSGYSIHAWESNKRTAMLVWRCHFEGRPFQRTLNYLHPMFYEMIRTPSGTLLVSEKAIRRF